MGHIAMTDAELVEASRRGQREAFGQLVTRYQDLVCAVSYSSTRDWNLSEDVAQDTFIAAWSQLGQLRETSRLRSWLCGIARNLAHKARRRTRREVEIDEALPALDDDPFATTAQAEVDRVVREALARIPDTYREPLVLYYCEQQSVREIAESLGIAEAAAMQRLSRGRRHLAAGVDALVERALRGPRTKRNLAASVLAALPIALPSRVDASPKPQGSTMLKLTIAAVSLATLGTTTALVVHARSSDATPIVSGTASAPSAAPTPPAAPTGTTGERAAPHARPAAPSLEAPAAPAVGEAERFSVDRLAALGLDAGPSRGAADAPVTIVVFQDLMCSFCGKSLATLDQLLEEYPGKVRIVVKQFPVHAAARLAAEASLAADAQGKFWELHDLMLANQDDLTRDALVGYATQAGLDVKKFAAALDHHTYQQALETEVSAGVEVGVQGTPSFLINGQALTGAQPIDAFRAAIDAALAAK
ncbi:MAG: sigma-70 family RNA polymerase sigma factor [Kofleriaceae bacterium]|nr:sigma-70 family RNA polymerase sigma factor [Kofleriaceae bacterium]